MEAKIPFLDSEQITHLLPYPELIEAIGKSFREARVNIPERQHYDIGIENEPSQTLLLMPAWEAGKTIGLKMVTVTPGNERRLLPAIQGIYILLDGLTGQPRLLLDGPTLTARRTAAASALAAKYLARHTAHTMLMVGTGALSLPLMEAHAACHPLERILIWGRNFEKAQAKVEEAKKAGLKAVAISDIAEGAREADLISCATLSQTPLIRGHWIKPGCHLDLVGGFTPKMREADDDTMIKARIFVDTRQGAMKEAGDITNPLSRGLIRAQDIAADLFDLCQGKLPGREGEMEITLFKSVGTAMEDLAGASLAFEKMQARGILQSAHDDG